MTDRVTPGYKALVANGAIVNSPYSREERKLANKSGVVIYTNTVYPLQTATFSGDYTCQVSNWGPFQVPLSDYSQAKLDSLIYQASVQARANIAPPDTLSLVSLVELPKTFDLIATQAKRLAEAVRLMRKGSPVKAINALLGSTKGSAPIPKNLRLKAKNDQFLNRWLETRYGWAPLVYDVQGHLKALDSLNNSKSRRLVARGRASDRVDVDISWQPLHSGGVTEPITFRRQIRFDVQARAYVLYEADCSFQAARAFGVTSVPLSVWELVPFSFVVDWFVNVGDWLSAISPKLGISTLAEGATVSISAHGTRRIVAETANPIWMSSNLIGWSDEAGVDIKYRTTALPTLLYPPIDVKLNPKRLLDSIALLARLR